MYPSYIDTQTVATTRAGFSLAGFSRAKQKKKADLMIDDNRLKNELQFLTKSIKSEK